MNAECIVLLNWDAIFTMELPVLDIDVNNADVFMCLELIRCTILT